MQWLGQLVFGLVFAVCFWMGTGAGISALIKSELTWYRPFLTDLGGLRFQLGVWIAIAFFGSRAVPDLHRPADPLRGMGAAAAAPGRGAGHRGGTIMSPIRSGSVLSVWFSLPLREVRRRLDRPIDSDPESPVRTVLKEQAYPWYDGEKDQVKPLLPDPSSWTSWLEKRLESFFDWLDRRFGKSGGNASGANGGSLRGVLATLLFVACRLRSAGHALAALADS